MASGQCFLAYAAMSALTQTAQIVSCFRQAAVLESTLSRELARP